MYTEQMKSRIAVCAAAVILAGALSGCGVTSALRMLDRQRIPLNQMVAEVKDAPLIFVGEIHDEPEHHELQQLMLRGVQATGKPMAIGLEMFNAESQPELDAWVEGRLDNARFIALYKRNWREPLGLYAGIFQYAREHRIPLVGLNVPRGVIQEVKRSGIQALPEEQRRKLPANIRCEGSSGYLDFMERVNAGHSGNEETFRNFCEAMTLWNSLMARNITDYLQRHPGTVMVVLAGAGHARKRGGIPEQLDRGEVKYNYRVILPELPDLIDPAQVSSDDADYLFEDAPHPIRRLLTGY